MAPDTLHLVADVADIARASLDAEIARHPDYPDLHLKLGLALARAGDLAAARVACARACEINPRFDLARAALGYVNLQAGLFEAARGLFDHARTADPDAAWAWNDLGVWWSAQGNAGEAVKAFDAAFDRAPANPVPLLNAAVALIDAGDFSAAGSYLRRAGALADACAEDLAAARIFRGEHLEEDAARAWASRLEQNRAMAVWYEYLGHLQSGEGNAPAARDAYRQAYAVAYDVDAYYANLGQLSAAQGDEERALREYAEGLRLCPDAVKIRLACAYEFARQGESRRAIRHFEEARDRAPRYADIHFNLGLLWYDEGDLDQAVECYLAALRINPDYAIARNALAFTLLRRGDYLLARQEYERTLANGLTSADILVNVARIHLENREAQKALTVLEEAIQVNPDYGPAHYHLGHAYQMLGMRKRARSARERFLRAAKDMELALHGEAEQVAS